MVLASGMMALGAVVSVTAAQEAASIMGSDGDDTLNGTPAGEAIYARAGNDRVNAGDGDDELDGGPGADVLLGGNGSDAVSYAGPTAISVTLDGRPDDGAVGEADNVGRDVEDIFGGDGNDNLTGANRRNVIDGGAGNDILNGGPGLDALYGSEGDDVIQAADGDADAVDCGPGADRASVDPVDVVSECELVAGAFALGSYGIKDRRVNFLLITGLQSGTRLSVTCLTRCGRSKSIRSGGPVARTGNLRLNLKTRVRPRIESVVEIRVVQTGLPTRFAEYRLGTQKRLTASGCIDDAGKRVECE